MSTRSGSLSWPGLRAVPCLFLPLVLAGLLCAPAVAPVRAQAGGSPSVADMYGPDGVPFTPDDPLEARANVWGAAMAASGWDRQEDRFLKDKRESKVKPPAPGKLSADDKIKYAQQELIYMNPNANGGSELELCHYVFGTSPPWDSWADLCEEDTNEMFKGGSKVRRLDESGIRTVWESSGKPGEHLEFHAPALSAIYWTNPSTAPPGGDEDVQDFASHLRVAERVPDVPVAKYLEIGRNRNSDVFGQTAAVYCHETGKLAMTTMFMVDIQGAGFRVKLDAVMGALFGMYDFLSDAVDALRNNLPTWLGGYSDEQKKKAKQASEFRDAVESGKWIEHVGGIFFDDVVAKELKSHDPPIDPAVLKDQKNLDFLLLCALDKAFPYWTWVHWKNVSHAFEGKFKRFAEDFVTKDSENKLRSDSGLLQARDDPNGFVWQRGSTFRMWNLYLGDKRRDMADKNAVKEWVDLVEDTGCKGIHARLVNVDPNNTAEVLPASNLMYCEDEYKVRHQVGWQVFDLVTWKTNTIEKITKNKLLPLPWPYPNWAGGQGIIVSCCGASGHYEPSITKQSDAYLPRRMFQYILCYNPYSGNPKEGSGSLSWWGLEMSSIGLNSFSSPQNLQYARHDLSEVPPPTLSGIPPLTSSKGRVRFVQAIVNNGFLPHVASSQASRKYFFFWDYDSDGKIDNGDKTASDEVYANTSHNWEGSGDYVATLFTVAPDGCGKTGFSQVPVYVE